MELVIGYFGDARLGKNGALIAQRVSERQTVCVRKLADDRSEQVKFRRFLSNEAVTVEEMVAHRAMWVAAATVAATTAAGRHAPAIQDISEVNYQAQSGRKHGLGKVGNGTDVGLFVHPVLAVDAQTLQKTLQGRTTNQQNPHPPDSLAWAGWTVARLGGWTGYDSDKSRGPITIRDGLERFYGIVDGYNLARNVCPS